MIIKSPYLSQRLRLRLLVDRLVGLVTAGTSTFSFPPSLPEKKHFPPAKEGSSKDGGIEDNDKYRKIVGEAEIPLKGFLQQTFELLTNAEVVVIS